mgnify:CR=1 FL=1
MGVKLMPHQRKIEDLAQSGAMRFPFYMNWHMGSGKTFGACAAMAGAVSTRGGIPRVLVLCDKSIEGQWRNAVQRFFDGAATPSVAVHRYQALNDNLRPSQYDMCVVDEAHRFRNAFRKDGERANEYATWIALIMRNPRVLYLSGTPLVADMANDMAAFDAMMQKSDAQPLIGRVSTYNPREDARKARYYAKERRATIECPMTWAQTMLYFLHQRNTFDITVAGVRRQLQSVRNNAYNVALRRISNMPWPNDPEESPKFRSILDAMTAAHAAGKKQLVYSSRRDTGARALLTAWNARMGDPKRAFLIDGSMDAEDRTIAVERFNRNMKGRPQVMFVTDAASQGVDLKGVGCVHLVEPSDSLMSENQVVNRAIRFRSHDDGHNAVVDVRLYVATFPEATTPPDTPRFEEVCNESGLWRGEQMQPAKAIVKALAEQFVQKDARGSTVDQKTVERREHEAHRIAAGMRDIMQYDPSKRPRPPNASKASSRDAATQAAATKKKKKPPATKSAKRKVATPPTVKVAVA